MKVSYKLKSLKNKIKLRFPSNKRFNILKETIQPKLGIAVINLRQIISHNQKLKRSP